MIGTGGCAILSKQMGENKVALASQNLSLLTIVVVVTGVVLTLIGTVFTESIATFLGAIDMLMGDAVAYLKTAACFAVPLLLMLISQMFFIADGRPMFGFGIGIVGGIVNMILDYIFIAMMGMGVAGAALATGIGYTIPALTFVIYFVKKNKQGLHFGIPKWDINSISLF